MPNHVKNRITLNGSVEQIKKLKEFVRAENDGIEFPLCFDKIIPMPKDLDTESSTMGEDALLYKYDIQSDKYFNRDKEGAKKRIESLSPKEKKKALELGDLYYNNYQKYGATNWYEWRIKNWDTKWNAYDFDNESVSQNEFVFSTAWSCPYNVFVQLSKMFPEVEIEVFYADEDMGSNVGKFTLLKGKYIKKNIPKNQSKAAYELFFELNPEYEHLFILKNNKYEYVGE